MTATISRIEIEADMIRMPEPARLALEATAFALGIFRAANSGREPALASVGTHLLAQLDRFDGTSEDLQWLIDGFYMEPEAMDEWKDMHHADHS